MVNKWLIARPKNIQPAAPRRHVVIYSSTRNGESEEDCYACCKKNGCPNLIIQFENNLADIPSKEEEMPEKAPEASTEEQERGDRQEDCYACGTKNESRKRIIQFPNNSTDIPCKEEEMAETPPEAGIGEQESGDGQESLEPEKKNKNALKHAIWNEYLWNPPSVPQQSYYFEHDLRGTYSDAPRKKNPWPKIHRRYDGIWKHDRYREEEQAPKSREELIATYGFDIRACENPDKIRPCKRKK